MAHDCAWLHNHQAHPQFGSGSPTFPTLEEGINVEMAGRGRAFQSSPELQQFLIPDVRPTGKQLGVGSYGSVEELEMNGLVCAGKRLHDALLQRDNAGVQNIERKYIEECQVMPTSYQRNKRLSFFLMTINHVCAGNGEDAAPTHRAVPGAVLPRRVRTASAGDGAIGQQSR